MERFVEKYGSDVTGILSGFGRLVFRGTARALAVTERLDWFLTDQHVLLKDWDAYVAKKTAELKKVSCAEAWRLGRPVRYLGSSRVSKEDVAQAIAKRDGIGEGLICVLTCVEPCWSFEIERNREKRRLVLVPRLRKCLFLYHCLSPQRRRPQRNSGVAAAAPRNCRHPSAGRCPTGGQRTLPRRPGFARHRPLGQGSGHARLPTHAMETRTRAGASALVRTRPTPPAHHQPRRVHPQRLPQPRHPRPPLSRRTALRRGTTKSQRSHHASAPAASRPWRYSQSPSHPPLSPDTKRTRNHHRRHSTIQRSHYESCGDRRMKIFLKKKEIRI